MAENDKVLLLIGTKQTRDNKNPLTFDEIKEILNIKYANNSKLKIMKLPDVPSDRIWTREVAKLLN
ncbi:MAG: hypothetical protein LBF15_07205 [Candidatus Peribacteria bacterium]|nr:hypothetical protein [Candidatus Peribacteria bacterium]